MALLFPKPGSTGGEGPSPPASQLENVIQKAATNAVQDALKANVQSLAERIAASLNYRLGSAASSSPDKPAPQEALIPVDDIQAMLDKLMEQDR